VSPTSPTSENAAGSAEVDDTELAAPKPRSPKEPEAIKEIEGLLRDNLGAHATYRDPRADAIMRNCIETCIMIAGSSTRRCLSALKCKLDDPDLVRKLMSATRPGGYIKSSFKGWYDDHLADASASPLDAICRWAPKVEFPDEQVVVWAPAFVDYLREKLGAHLPSAEQVADDDGVSVKAEITDRAKIAHLLTHATGTKVSADSVPECVDNSTVKQVIAMIDDERWASGLRKAKDPLHHFLTYREEVEVEDELEEATPHDPGSEGPSEC
jgi:hypothetical protein